METIDDVDCPNPNCDAKARTHYNPKTGHSYTTCLTCGWDSDNDDDVNDEIIQDTLEDKDDDDYFDSMGYTRM